MHDTAHAIALTFLDPASGIIAGAIAVPALLLLYFLKLRRRPVRVSATFLWERAAEDLQVNAPFRMLRPSALLLLQLLAILLLCGALARPALTDDAPPSGRIVILIDASASMRATDAEDGATRLDDAKRRAARFLDSIDLGGRGPSGERTEAMVIAMAASPRVVANYSTDRGLLRNAVFSIEPTDQPADMNAAVDLLRAFAAGSSAGADGSDAPPPTIVVYSDGAWPAPAPGAARSVQAGEVRFERAGPAPEASKENIGVVAISARRDERQPSTVRVFLRLLNASSERRTAQVVLERDGAPARSESFELPPAGEDGPGERAAVMEVEAPGRTLLTARLASEDALASDDSASVVVREPGGPRVLVTAQSSEVPGRAAASVFLTEALGALDLREARVVTPAEYERLLENASFPYDLVVFDRVRPGALPPAPSLSFGAGLPIPGLGVEAPEEGARATRFLAWRRTHPVMRYVVLDSVLVARPLTLALPDPESGAVDAITPLAQGERGPLIALLERGSRRRIIVAFDPERSTWPVDVSFAIFVANAVDFLAGASAGEGGVAHTTTSPIGVRPEPGVERLVATGPVTLSASAPTEPGEAAVFAAIPLAGVYAVQGAQRTDAILAVNLADAWESSLTTRDDLPLVAGGETATTAGGAAPTELWQWFVLIAAGLLTLEWLLYAWQMRV